MPWPDDMYAPPGDPTLDPSSWVPPEWSGVGPLAPPGMIDQVQPPPQAPAPIEATPAPAPIAPTQPEMFPAGEPEPEMNFAPDDFSSPEPSGLEAQPQTDESPIEDPYPEATAVDTEVQRQATLSPEQQAEDAARREVARESLMATRRLEESQINEQRIVENQQIMKRGQAEWQRERAEVMADIKALSNASIDDDQWWNSKGDGMKVGLAIAAGLGGYLNVMAGKGGGGSNTVLNTMSQQIDRNVQSQKEQLSRKRGLLGERMTLMDQLYAQTGDEYRAAETVRIAMYQGVDAKLGAEAARYDPAGTMAQRITEARMGVQAKGAAAAAAMEQTMYDRSQDKAKLDLDMRKEEREAKAQRDASARGWAGLKLDKDKFKAEQEAKAAAGPDTKLAIRDPRTGAVLGTADNLEKGKGAQTQLDAYHELMAMASEFESLAAKGSVYDGPGGRLVRSDDEDKRVARMKKLQVDMARKSVKVNDPTSVVSKAEIEAELENMPAFETVTGKSTWKENLDSLKRNAGEKVKISLGGSGVPVTPENDPTGYYANEETPDDSPAKSAARAAAAYVPKGSSAPGAGPLSLVSPAASSFEKAAASQVPLLGGVQASAPIADLEQQARAGKPEERAEALSFLRGIAGDPTMAGAPLAQQALERLEPK